MNELVSEHISITDVADFQVAYTETPNFLIRVSGIILSPWEAERSMALKQQCELEHRYV